MPLSTKLNRKLRAEEEDTDGEEFYEVSDRSSPSVIDTGEGADIISSEEDQDGEEDEGDESNDDQYEARLSKVSFGALAKAQESLSKEQAASKKRKRGEGEPGPQEDKLEALRQRLRALKAEKLAALPAQKPSKKAKTAEKKSSKPEPAQDDEEDSDDAGPDEKPFARSSKHAPRVQSSKRAVTRKRTAVEVPKAVSRDPRFDQLSGIGPNEHTLKNRYSFLDDYRKSEIADLRASLKKCKNEGEKAQLRRQLLSMESQQKARERKDKEQEVVQKHKKQEKELVKDGKQPFYLKKGTLISICAVIVVCTLVARLRPCHPCQHTLTRL
jgi:ribosomal RNA-processing protein 36